MIHQGKRLHEIREESAVEACGCWRASRREIDQERYLASLFDALASRNSPGDGLEKGMGFRARV